MAKKLSCPKCSRKFSMRAHLVRHVNTTHGGGRSTAKKRGPGRPKGSKKRAAPFASAAPLGDGLGQVVDNMQRMRDDLVARRDTLNSSIDAVDRALDAMGGAAPPAAPSPARRGRPRGSGAGGRSGSLKDYITRVLGQASHPLSPREIGIRVKQAGYPTKARNLTLLLQKKSRAKRDFDKNTRDFGLFWPCHVSFLDRTNGGIREHLGHVGKKLVAEAFLQRDRRGLCNAGVD